MHRSVRPGTTMEVDFGESWAEVAGVPRKVKYLVAALQQRVFRQGVSARAARVAARRDRVGVHVFPRRPGDSRQHVVGGQAGAVRAGPLRPRRSRRSGAPIRSGRSSVRRRRAGRRAPSRRASSMCQPGVPAAAGGGELGGAQCAVTELEADLPPRPRRWAPGAGRVAAGAAASAGATRSSSRDLPHRRAGGRQVRACTGGPHHLFGADRPCLPASMGEAVSRPGGGRRRGSRSTPARSAGARRSSMRGTCCRCSSASTGPCPRRRRSWAGGWRPCGSRCAPRWPRTRASRSGMGPDVAGWRHTRPHERAVSVALERHSPRLETVRLILRQQQAGPPAACRPGCRRASGPGADRRARSDTGSV